MEKEKLIQSSEEEKRKSEDKVLEQIEKGKSFLESLLSLL